MKSSLNPAFCFSTFLGDTIASSRRQQHSVSVTFQRPSQPSLPCQQHFRRILPSCTTSKTSVSSTTRDSSRTDDLPKPSKRLETFLLRSEEGDPLRGLARAEAAFTALKRKASSKTFDPQKDIVKTSSSNTTTTTTTKVDYDVIVAGGTLGIIYATALQTRGWRVAVIERGAIRGRTQEWNISREELSSLVLNNVITQTQLEECIVTECKNPGRIGFTDRRGNMRSIYVPEVLNIGVAPDILVEKTMQNFIANGGVVYERHALEAVDIRPDSLCTTLRKVSSVAVAGALGAGGQGLLGKETEDNEKPEIVQRTARLLMDAMGSFSPIAQQVRASNGQLPDGVCITVGACMTSDSWPEKLEVPDVLLSRSSINASRSAQYFWEAFPVGRDPTARTAYMFAYGECNEQRQTLTSALEDYVDSIESYQGVSVEKMTSIKRILFGFFPSYYRSSTPVRVAFDRILPVGDAGGLQSPISFGGFGCCTRHLSRISNAVNDALNDQSDGLLTRTKLDMIQWYLPSLAVTGLFHKAMSVPAGEKTAGPLLDAHGINDVLWQNMNALKSAGAKTQMTFLRDVVTADGLTKTLALMAVTNPTLAIRLSAFVGVSELISWTRHYIALVGFAAARPVVMAVREWAVGSGSIGEHRRYWLDRLVDGVTYGSGLDAVDQTDIKINMNNGPIYQSE